MSKKSQSEITTISNYPGFWDRLTDCLGTKKTGEIAEILDVSDSLVSDWKGNRAFPTIVKLFEIARLGGTTVDWLLTNKEPKNVSVSVDDSKKPIDSYIRKLLYGISKETGQDVTELMHQLIEDGLTLRGELTFHPKENLRNPELKVIFPVLKWFDNLNDADKQNFGLKMINLLIARLSGKALNFKKKGKSSITGKVEPIKRILVEESNLNTEQEIAPKAKSKMLSEKETPKKTQKKAS